MLKIKNLSLYLSMSLIFTSCTFKEVDVQKNTDELLSCKKLTTQIADLMDINKDINEETGLAKTSLTLWILWPPIGTYNQYNAFMARDKIDNRLDHLLNLKSINSCKVTSKERYYIDNKGRLSDIIKKL